jgi:GDP-4-dehydro-6-deoxy-D-mannose reductase
VVATGRTGPEEPAGSERWIVADLADAHAARQVVASAAPDHVFHLAGQAFVPPSWDDRGATVRDNVLTTLNLLEGIREEAAEARVVVVSSGEIYGPPVRLPVDEDAPLRPQNPYAVSKAAADLVAGFYSDGHGLAVIRARAFNNAGPGQSPDYALASFTRQLARAQVAGERPVRIVTGNPASRRDYTDVRDVVRAYRRLAERAPPGAYNVCSGRSTSIAELLELLAEGTGEQLDHVIDDRLIREGEVLEVRGDPRRIAAATGWQPEIDLRQTLTDTVGWWRARLQAEQPSVSAAGN